MNELFLKKKMENHKQKKMLNLEEVLLPKIKTYLALYCFCQNENDVIAYFKDIVKKSYRTFRQLRKAKYQNQRKKDKILNLFLDQLQE